MKKNKKQIDPIEAEEQYVEFLRKRLESKNFKSNAPLAEQEATKAKYDKAKLKLKMMREGALKKK